MELLTFGVSLGALIAAIVSAVLASRVEKKLEKLERAGVLITADKAVAPKPGRLSRKELAQLIEKRAAARTGV